MLTRRLPVLCTLFLLACAARTQSTPLTPAREVETLVHPIDDFYGKRLMDGRLPVLGHVSVTDEGLLAAREHLERLLAHAPKLRANLESARYELHVNAFAQYTSDLPEFKDSRGSKIDTGELFDWHMIGGHLAGRTSSCAEATLLPVVGHRLYGDDTCVHELAHAVEWVALSNDMRARIAEAYQRSLDSGHWKGEYAGKNSHEWFAEITKFYFRATNVPDFYSTRLSQKRQWLCEYDADACALVRDLYGGVIDPGTIAITDVAVKPAADEASLRSVSSSAPVRLYVHNRAAAPVRVTWIDFAGARDLRPEFVNQPPLGAKSERVIFTFAGHAWVVTDLAGRALCAFVAPNTDGRVEVGCGPQ